jgi:hypothetical protein
MIHPAGLKLFGGFRSQELLPAKIQLPERYGQKCSTVIRIHDHFKFIWVVFNINNQPLNIFNDEQNAIIWLKERGDLPFTEFFSTDFVVLDSLLKVVGVFNSSIDAQDWIDNFSAQSLGDTFHIQERTDSRFNSVYLQRRDTRDVNPFYFDPIDARIRSQRGELALIHNVVECVNSAKLGPSYRSIERDKFTYRPFENPDITSQMFGTNAGYWGIHNLLITQFANYQIKDFKDITVKEITERPWTKINIMPESVLKNSDGTSIKSLENFGTADISSV